MLIQAETGLVSITGTPETPSKVGISIADISCGMYAYSGILTALLVRAKTGEGVALETSLFDSLGEWMSYATYYTTYGGTPPPRTGASHATIAPYGPARTGDNKVVYLGLQNEREWKKFCDVVLQNPQLATDPRFDSNANRVRNRPQLDQGDGGSFSEIDCRGNYRAAGTGADRKRENEHGAGIFRSIRNSMREIAGAQSIRQWAR